MSTSEELNQNEIKKEKIGFQAEATTFTINDPFTL